MNDFSRTMRDMLSNTGLSRRGFLGGAAALGAMSATAGGLLVPATAHAADEPKRGGHLKLGLTGGATSDTLQVVPMVVPPRRAMSSRESVMVMRCGCDARTR